MAMIEANAIASRSDTNLRLNFIDQIPPSNARRSRADDVYDALKRDIANFKLVPGDRFTETEIGERFEVSRTPVREALFRLQQDGMVEVVFRNGWKIKPFDFNRFDQLYELRVLMETAAIARLTRAEGSLSPHGQWLLAGLCERWFAQGEGRCRDSMQVAQWDEDFHCNLVKASGNEEMARMHLDITNRIRIVRRLDFTKAARVDITYDEHAAILRAVLAKQGESATLLLKSHIEVSRLEVRKITLHQVQLAREAAHN